MSSQFELLQRAIDFEKGGLDYFKQAMDKAAHPTTQSLFQMLVNEEKLHMDYLHTLYETLKATDKWPDEVTISLDKDFKLIFQEEQKNIDANVKVSSDELEALKHAMDMESKGRAMYMELAESAGSDNEKKLYKLLADWEQGHYEYIENFFDYYQDHGMFTEE